MEGLWLVVDNRVYDLKHPLPYHAPFLKLDQIKEGFRMGQYMTTKFDLQCL